MELPDLQSEKQRNKIAADRLRAQLVGDKEKELELDRKEKHYLQQGLLSVFRACPGHWLIATGRGKEK